MPRDSYWRRQHGTLGWVGAGLGLVWLVCRLSPIGPVGHDLAWLLLLASAVCIFTDRNRRRRDVRRQLDALEARLNDPAGRA